MGAGLDELVLQVGHNPGAMIAEATGVDGRWDEVVAQRVHEQQQRHAHRVAEVVAELAAGQLRAGGRLARDAADLFACGQVLAEEGERDAGEVGSATEWRNDHVGQFPAFSIA